MASRPFKRTEVRSLRPLLHARHIANAHRHAVDGADHHGGELGRTLQVGGCGHIELAQAALDPPGRHFQVGAAQRVLHVLRGQPEGRQPVRVQPDAHRVLALAEHAHIRGARRRLQHGLGKRLARSLSCRELSVSELNASQITGKASASTLAITGSSMPWGKRWRTRLTLSRTSAAAESASRDKRKRMDLALLLAADRGDDVHAFDACQRVFQHLGDLALDHLAGCAGVTGFHRDHWLVDLGVLAHRRAG
jgi:hypothetical protein